MCLACLGIVVDCSDAGPPHQFGDCLNEGLDWYDLAAPIVPDTPLHCSETPHALR